MGKKKYKLSASSNTTFQQAAKRADLPMALTITPNLTDVNVADVVTNWEVENLSAGSGIDTDQNFQGSGCFAGKSKNATAVCRIYYNNGSDIDLTGEIVRIWVRLTELSKYETAATPNPGFGMYVEDSSGNWGQWILGGSDSSLNESWTNYAVNADQPFDETSATSPTMTVIRKIGIFTRMTSSPNRSENMFVDAIRYGPGLTITGTNTVVGDGFSEIALADEDDSNKYGILTTLDGGGYLLSGNLTFGDSAGTGSVDFTDNKNSKIFMRTTNMDGAPVTGTQLYMPGSVDGNLGINIVGNGTGTTDFELGTLLGSGDDRQGVLGGTFSSQLERFNFDSETDTSDIDSCNLYGVTFEGSGVIQIAGSTTQEAIGCTFINCEEVQPNTSEFLNNKIIAPSDRGVEIIASHAIQQIDFIAGSGSVLADSVYRVTASSGIDSELRDFNDTTGTGDANLIGAVGAVNDYAAFGSRFKFTKMTINLFSARSAGVLDWEYWDGSAWSALVIITDGTNTLSTTGENSVTWRLPNDWAKTTIANEPPLYYIRSNVSSALTGNPQASYGFFDDIVEHHVHAPVAGTFAATELSFVGFSGDKKHTENSANSTTTDSYAVSNQDSDQSFSAITGIAQAFTGDGNVLTGAGFLIKYSGTPLTGTFTANLYAHQGTFGTTSVPTGPILASSNDVAASEATTAYFLFHFSFEDEFTLVNTTKYVIALEYSGDSGNFIRIGYDSSSPTHGGNISKLSGSWAPTSTEDLIFFVYTDAIVKFNAVDSNMSSKDNTGSPPGTTIIATTVNITVTAIDALDSSVIASARVYIEAAAGGDLAVGTPILTPDSQLTNGSGIVTDTFNYTNDQPITGRVRRSTTSPLYKTSILTGTITNAGLTLIASLVKDE